MINLRLSGVTRDSVADGPGIRLVIFAQGCLHKCPYCHNPETWDSEGGRDFPVKQVIRQMRRLVKNRQGVTFSGGEPFLQAEGFACLAREAHRMGWDTVTYTGFTYEQLAEHSGGGIQALLDESDILIDGKYIHELRDISLRFRGSSNQRIIDMAATRKNGPVLLWS